MGSSIHGLFLVMDFNSYLEPSSSKLIRMVSQKGYAIKVNTRDCKNKEMFGVVNQRDFVICLDNIKNNISPVRHYVNETVIHEAVHVAQSCKGGRLGLKVSLDQYKTQDAARSVKATGSDSALEKEAYYLEGKPDRVIAYLRKYCF
jgi:hypothetical protein